MSSLKISANIFFCALIGALLLFDASMHAMLQHDPDARCATVLPCAKKDGEWWVLMAPSQSGDRFIVWNHLSPCDKTDARDSATTDWRFKVHDFTDERIGKRFESWSHNTYVQAQIAEALENARECENSIQYQTGEMRKKGWNTKWGMQEMNSLDASAARGFVVVLDYQPSKFYENVGRDELKAEEPLGFCWIKLKDLYALHDSGGSKRIIPSNHGTYELKDSNLSLYNLHHTQKEHLFKHYTLEQFETRLNGMEEHRLRRATAKSTGKAGDSSNSNPSLCPSHPWKKIALITAGAAVLLSVAGAAFFALRANAENRSLDSMHDAAHPHISCTQSKIS